MLKKQIYAITGQTAAGKTDYALRLAGRCNGELISCDSRQVYRQLNVVTGKNLPPRARFYRRHHWAGLTIGYYLIPSPTGPVPVWLYDLISPDQACSSYDWARSARWAIDDIQSRNKTPVIVGGTYLYLKHLLYGVQTETIAPDWALRRQLASDSIPQLQARLEKEAPQQFARLSPSDRHNPQRLIRKIEIARHPDPPGPRPLSLIQDPAFRIELTGIRYRDRADLVAAIKIRVEARLRQGAVSETKRLLKQYPADAPGLHTIGYTQLIAWLSQKNNLDQVKDQWITKEVQYAKRQYTFMKTDRRIRWRLR
ncbi:hypothetical protein M1523_00055 [Patescibacteria group bacterium]|nr:hypothetical protein [Patescibacteria group bacterium]MCL5091790.1 hypothetical protein [Patescibacteria group bacterium]